MTEYSIEQLKARLTKVEEQVKTLMDDHYKRIGFAEHFTPYEDAITIADTCSCSGVPSETTECIVHRIVGISDGYVFFADGTRVKQG